MKNLIALISVCVFLSFSFISKEKNNLNNTSLSGKILSSEKKAIHFKNFLDSAENGDSSAGEGEPPVPGPLRDYSNMFNERGFYKSNGFSFDEQEIINDFNGNLLYNIPLYNYALPGDLIFDVGLTYNGSVGHMFHTGNTHWYEIGYSGKYNMSSPEWIFNINGIGIQVLNFETNFFTNEIASSVISGNNVHALIPGYHYSNQLSYPNIDNPDRINILAGDGSVITLENEVDSSFIGNYSYEGKELFYKARVTFIDSDLMLKKIER